MGLEGDGPPDRVLQLTVQRGRANTILLPDDLPLPDHTKWFSPQAKNRETTGNTVTFFLTGAEAYTAMAGAIKAANGADALIGLFGWALELDMPLDPADPRSTMNTLLADASGRSVRIRVMLNAFFKDPSTGKPFKGNDNAPAVAKINTLATGGAIEDERNLDLQVQKFFKLAGPLGLLPRIIVGSHHQKLLIVATAGSIKAFIGGRDIAVFNRDAHDVHGLYQGPVAAALAKVFVERWNDHPRLKTFTGGKLLPLTVPPAGPAPAPAKQAVQIGTTYPNGDKHEGIGTKSVPSLLGPSTVPAGYGFISPPGGDTSIRGMVLHAIDQAKTFIYVEDQFLVDRVIRERLKQRLQAVKDLFVIMVTNGAEKNQGNQMDMRRELFLRPLLTAAPDRALAFTVTKDANYVHSKLWIFDDQYVINGSANCNSRGYTHDSEVVAGTTDPEPVQSEFGAKLYLAHVLRMKLWAIHLGLLARDLAVPSPLFWKPLPSTARVNPWVVQPNAGSPTDPWGMLYAGYTAMLSKQVKPIADAFLKSDVMWDLIIDPDGS